jgi:hypothetical protein
MNWAKWMLIPIGLLLMIGAAHPQDSCVSDDACHSGECAVYDHGRWVCQARQYTVAVWDHSCLEKVDLAMDAKFEAQLDYEGKPDTRNGKLVGAVVTLKQNCQFRYEVRTRSAQ